MELPAAGVDPWLGTVAASGSVAFRNQRTCIKKMAFCILWTLLLLAKMQTAAGQGSAGLTQTFHVPEEQDPDTPIGTIGEGLNVPPPPYFVLSDANTGMEEDLNVNSETGAILVRKRLDRERKDQYRFVAVSTTGKNIIVNIIITDINDHAPKFPQDIVLLNIIESSPRDATYPLGSAVDPDLGINSTQGYEIIEGNINNAFRLSSHRGANELLYLDLDINIDLDYEVTNSYSLLIRAYDGGTPQKYGFLRVNITIIDSNDNQPIFNQSRYFAQVSESAPIGKSVLQVFATDRDSGDNGKIRYHIDRGRSDPQETFQISATSGVIIVKKELDYESKRNYELIVVARDNGTQKLQTTAIVSVTVMDVNDNEPTIDLIFLTQDGTGRIAETAEPGDFVARISVSDPDVDAYDANVNVSLSGGEGHFGLTTRNNVVYLVILSKPLDREMKPFYSLTVTATDAGYPPLQTLKTFSVSVSDTNDNSPSFAQSTYYADIQEVVHPGSSVIQITAEDQDRGNNSRLLYEILNTPDTHSEWFHIDNRTGLITTKAHVDCETASEPRLIVVATDSGVPPRSASATVIIRIRDVNDNQPVFDQSFYNVSVAESAAVGSCILTVTATDPDCGVNARVTYAIATNLGFDLPQDLAIRDATGQICIEQQLDYETKRTYDFPVLAKDQDGLDTTAMVKVTVQDVNDNHPSFYPSLYNVNIEQDSRQGDEVVVVQATDPDSGDIGKVRYSIVRGNENGLFAIGTFSGVISLARPLGSSPQVYVLSVQARDGGGLTSQTNANVSVSVLQPNQQPPIFSQTVYHFSIAEDASDRARVGEIEATNSNPAAGVISYSVISGDPNNFFTVDMGTGDIRVDEPLDHDTVPYVLLSVQAESGSPPSYGRAQVNISITDVNDNPPLFPVGMIEISVKENTPVSTTLFVVQATDIDSGANGHIQYSIDDTSSIFKVDGTTGALRAKRLLDYEEQWRHEVVIHARDNGVPVRESTMRLVVTVQDVNDNAPVFSLSLYSFTVLESTAVNSKFAQVNASDKDSSNNGRLMYSLERGTDNDAFGIFSNDGYLYNKINLDRERKALYTLRVVAMDNGIPTMSATADINIQILDANDNSPVFQEPQYTFHLAENQPAKTSIGYVSATDRDQSDGSNLQYSITTVDAPFEVNSLTGEIKTKASLDRENQEIYSFTVQATDDGQPPQTTTVVVSVKILDTNDNSPVFTHAGPYEATVAENQKKETFVIQVSATDADDGDNASVSYYLANELASQMFSIHAHSGLIVTKEVLDHETRSSYTLKVIARDNGSPSRETSKEVVVTVEDKNDSPPMFESAHVSFDVDENTAPGTVIGSVKAHDEDIGENGNVQYFIVHGNWFGTFGVNAETGEIFAAMLVDFEVASEHSIRIRAVDSSATNPMSALITVNITVKDRNDNAPTFEDDPVLLSIAENTRAGTSVYKFNAVDKDSGPNGLIYYSISSQSPENNWFTIEAATGVLRVAKVMDYESITDVSLLVRATDQAIDRTSRLTSHVNVLIMVEDVNDNKPEFQNRAEVDVMEDEPVGFPLIHMIATDTDSHENGHVSYAIISGNERGHFRLHSSTGLLTVGHELDHEVVTEYHLNITARDNGHPRQMTFIVLNIHVVDVNDNPPSFQHSVYTATVEENQPIGAVVASIKAQDPDKGKNAELVYIIPDGIADNQFSVSLHTGVITTSAVLDREAQDSWVITAYVKDGAFPALYDTTTVMVTVRDTNDNAPVFKDTSYFLEVPENSRVSVVHTVIAMDADAGAYGSVTYSIVDGNVDSRFSIDANTGKLSCRALDREETSAYTLSILAEDGGNPPNTSIALVNVKVLDDNDNHPIFSQPFYATSIVEDIGVGQSVLQVTATDADDGINARVSYHINNTDDGPFKIDNVTGLIRTTGPFDREKKFRYTFEVYAIDGGLYGPRHETVRLEITIDDINDNAPVFVQIPYVANISLNHGVNQYITQVSAQDKDIGPNGEVTYYLITQTPYFSIDTFSGTITTRQRLLPEAVRVHTLEVVAKDKGRPQLSSTGLVEIMVGNAPGAGALAFTNLTYHVNLQESSPMSASVLTLQARFASSGVGPITYGFASGNEDHTFNINSNTGYISVADPTRLDYEVNPRLRLIALATAGTTTCYATIWVQLVDINDNPPVFIQDRFTSSVWEENNRGTYVTQVRATDEDTGKNGRISYHIMSGNTQNAFEIRQNSGIVMTQIQLDREIQESYRLEIEAVDQGSPPMSSRCTLKILVIDVNDNKPNFPTYPPREIREGAELGFLVHQVTANDMDLKPNLVYEFVTGGNPDDTFSIDRFSGRIVVARELDHEDKAQYILAIMASDGEHNDTTNLVVNVVDENDNPPEFSQQSYQVTLPELTGPHYSVVTVNATDIDAGDNARITYSMVVTDGFYIDQLTGTIFTNLTVMYNPAQPVIHLGVTARDHGNPALSAVAAVRVQVIDINNHAPAFLQNQYRGDISEDERPGVTIVSVQARDQDDSAENKKIDYSIISGNEENVFQISSSNGDVLLVGALDREQRSQYDLVIMAQDRGEPALNSTTQVIVAILDVNDNAPLFEKPEYDVQIAEDVPVARSVVRVRAVDSDAGQNGRVTYIISSGNDDGVFEIGRDTGLLSVRSQLDHETKKDYRLIIRATDSSVNSGKMSSYTTVNVNVTDVNEFSPIFPVLMYIESVMEGQDIATSVFTAHANDKDGGIYGIVEYQLQNQDFELFAIDRLTGLVTTAAVFDYEAKQEYKFRVVASDRGGQFKDVQVLVNIERKFVPMFAKMEYQFVVPGNAKIGDVIGQVQAVDKDTGNAGHVRYSLEEQNEYFDIGLDTGIIFVIKNLQDTEDSRRRKRFVASYPHKFTVISRYRRALEENKIILNVVASTGGLNKAVTKIEVEVNRTCPGCALILTEQGGVVNGAPLVLIIVFVIIAVILAVVIIIMYWRNRERKRHPPESNYDSSFETMDVHPPPMPRGLGQPPSYNDISHFPHRVQDPNITTSELSDQSHSASSGRGSAEDADDVDEEIRMINATPLDTKGLRMPDSGIQQDDDAMSEHSVQNHQEYLARLGIDSSKIKMAPPPPQTGKGKGAMGSSVESMHQFSDEGGGEGQGLDIHNLVLSKLGEVEADENLAIMDGTREFGFGETEPSHAGSLSSVINSEEEFSGSYNWDYLLDWGPQYQPLADVFAEIARLKDDSIKPKQQPTHIVPQRTNHTLLHPQVKTVPPPIITNAPPRAVLAQPVSTRPGGTGHSQNSSSSSSLANSARTSQLTSLPSLPRSPISHESSFTSPALSPSFTPSLTPLATRSPSISPLVSAKGVGSGHSSSGHSGHNTPRRSVAADHSVAVASSGSEQEIHI